MPGLDPQSGVPVDRLAARLSLKETLERHSTAMGHNRRALDMNHLYRQAYEMLSSRQCREAFKLSAEPVKLRNRYGRHRSGQACLLARRLVEAGVPLITVIWNHTNRGQDSSPDVTDQYGWDTHNDGQLNQHLLIQELDSALSTLVLDLERHRMLDKTLVVVASEFGRPANFDGGGGRGHHSKAFSIVLAGGGLRNGKTIGTTDEMGMTIESRPISLPDLHATIHCALGIDPSEEIYTDGGRPVPITDMGKPVAELFA